MPVGVLGRLVALAVGAARRPSVIIIGSLRRSGIVADPLRLFLMQIAQYLLDPILMGDGFVEAELDLRHAPQAQAAADMTA